MSRQSIIDFIDSLSNTPEGPFFNPWFDRDEKHDVGPEAPEIRRKQLLTYLFERLKTAKYLCIAEALGYQGGHFTGIAMTSERILLGHHKPKHGVAPDHVFKTLQPKRTSKPSVKELGMTEPTATIMWKALLKLGIDPYEVVLWNALPWHPFDPEDGLLSNRTPTNSELEHADQPLRRFLDLFPGCQIIAVGKKCVYCLNDLDIPHLEVRHPANGGATKFRNQMKEIANGL